MLQRRSRKDEEQTAMLVSVPNEVVSLEEVAVGELSLEEDGKLPNLHAVVGPRASSSVDPTRPSSAGTRIQSTMTPLNVQMSVDEMFRQEQIAAKRKHWQESPFAAGLVEITWRDELCCGASRNNSSSSPNYMAGITSAEIDPDSSGCLWCSGLCCPRIGAGRVGNMAVLYQVQEWIEQLEEDQETGEKRMRRFTRPRLVWLMGPYWPMLVFVTYPIIFGVSFWALMTSIPRVSPWIQVVWVILTLSLIYALAMTAFRDPGILHRYHEPPAGSEHSWRWCDAAQSYRPRGAVYDPDCGVVVEGFDHTCPWTGTAIGKKNMTAFQCFVGLVFICLVMDILLITGAFF